MPLPVEMMNPPPQLLRRGVIYPDVPTYGQYGQLAVDMAGRPVSANGPRPNYVPLGALPDVAPTPGSGGGGGSSANDWLSALMMGGRLADLSGISLSDLFDRFNGGGGTISPELAEQAHQGASDTSATNEAINSELGSMAAPPLAEVATTPSGVVEVAQLGESAGLLGGGTGGMAGLAAGAEAGAMSGVAATQAATEAALLSQAAPTLAPVAGEAAGAGAAAGGMTAGLAASLGLAALPTVLYYTHAFGDPRHDQQSQLQRAYQGLGLTPIRTNWGQDLLMLPNGEFIAARGITSTLDDRFGKESHESLMNWLNSQARVDYRIPTIERGGNRRPD